jgi:hypothetical protein
MFLHKTITMNYKFIIALLILLCFGNAIGFAQTEPPATYIEKSRVFSASSDYANALSILQKGLALYEEEESLQREYIFVALQAGKNKEALSYAKAIANKEEPEEASITIAGMALQNNQETKAFEKLYKKGFKLYPNNGRFYADYGEQLLIKGKKECVTSWEKGMELDPNYSGNYYFAAKYYQANDKIIRSIICAEIFVNLESYSTRTIELKTILFNNLKTVLTETDIEKKYSEKGNAFVNAYLTTLKKAGETVDWGIKAESLGLIRSRFNLVWQENYNDQYEFRLFDHHRQLLVDGTFDAYNQWLFGPIENMTAYQQWINGNKVQNDAFLLYQRNRIFKIPTGQFYF